MSRLILLILLFASFIEPSIACTDDPNVASNEQLAYRVAYIEQYLGIPQGQKETLNNGGLWIDSEKRTTLKLDKGRLDRLAGQLGYKWFVESEGDWPDWHKVSDECLPPKCLDTSLGM